MAGVRLAKNSPDNCTFELFRFGSQLAVAAFDSSKLPECIVTSITASSTPSIQVKDGKYLEDLRIKGIFKGTKLNSINPTDLRARITYRNNQSDEAMLKVNSANTVQTNKADKTVPGSTYAHSFDVDSISGHNLNGTNGEYSFVLNLDGVDMQSFPTSFLIEFYNKVDSEKILPY